MKITITEKHWLHALERRFKLEEKKNEDRSIEIVQPEKEKVKKDWKILTRKPEEICGTPWTMLMYT